MSEEKKDDKLKGKKIKEQVILEIVYALSECEPILAHGVIIIQENKWVDLIATLSTLRSKL